MVKVKRSLALVSFKRASLVECMPKLKGFFLPQRGQELDAPDFHSHFGGGGGRKKEEEFTENWLKKEQHRHRHHSPRKESKH